MRPELIEAFATAFTVQQLQEKITATAQQVAANPTLITSASTGGGTSYARIERVPVTELLALYVAALKYKETGELGSGSAQSFSVTFNRAS